MHLSRKKLYIVVLSWKHFYKNKLEKSDLKIFLLIEELRGSWFDVKKVTMIPREAPSEVSL